MRDLTPYDTGARAEPKIRPAVPSNPDSYGKVDFENDESAALGTVWIESDPHSGYVLRFDGDSDVVLREDPSTAPEIVAALETYDEACASFATQAEESERTGRDIPHDAYYSRDDSAVAFADAVSEWVRSRLGMTAPAVS